MEELALTYLLIKTIIEDFIDYANSKTSNYVENMDAEYVLNNYKDDNDINDEEIITQDILFKKRLLLKLSNRIQADNLRYVKYTLEHSKHNDKYYGQEFRTLWNLRYKRFIEIENARKMSFQTQKNAKSLDII